MNLPSTNFWKTKLAAFLHDPPSKCLDIRTHGERSDAAFRQAGFVDAEIGAYFKNADHLAAAADRLPFPSSQASGLHCAFDGIRNAFLHPLCGEKLEFHAEFKSVEQAMEGEETVQPVQDEASLAALKDDTERWRARFFAHWRLWSKRASEKDYRLSFLPADTRIPDHSIWTHMQVTSAIAGCVCDGKFHPAFLKFQLGPVQDFIATARSIRDLWSGSYLLSWLMAAGLKALSVEIGPDAVIFPNLCGQPLFDLHWRNDLWKKATIGGKSAWDSLNEDHQFQKGLHTPNLPNVFLAVVPASQAARLAEIVEKAVRQEWGRIAEKVWSFCDSQVLPGTQQNLTADEGAIQRKVREQRFNAQVASFLNISWQATPWPESLDQAIALAKGFDPQMPVALARDRVLAVKQMAEEHMPEDHRDGRYYVGGNNGPKNQLNNIGLGWSVILAFNSWQLDAVRQTRDFNAWAEGGWSTGTGNNKDSLNGRDEAVAGGKIWMERCQNLGEQWKSRFKKDDWLGAVTLIKRLWDLAYLSEVWGLEKQKMPNTRGIAAHDPFAQDKRNDEEEAEEVEKQPASEKYFAVLALDGDEIGKWVSGEKTPAFKTQLADYADGSKKQRLGAKDYFERNNLQDFLGSSRPLSPGYHLQFSQALANFALLCARPIVEAFHGRIIYAGGDDVLALLPADYALACARSLRCAFTGQKTLGPEGEILFESPAPGFLSSESWKDDNGKGRPIPFLVPGPAADCSVGIAMAHFKSPLQDVVRAAQSAEKRAKRPDGKGGLGRSAVAVTLFKRSGEILEWGCRWNSGGLDLHDAVLSALKENVLSAKFPHRLVELLEPYTAWQAGTARMKPHADFDQNAIEIILQELWVALNRQRGKSWTASEAETISQNAEKYLQNLHTTQNRLIDLIGLMQSVAFASRNKVDSTNVSQS